MNNINKIVNTIRLLNWSPLLLINWFQRTVVSNPLSILLLIFALVPAVNANISSLSNQSRPVITPRNILFSRIGVQDGLTQGSVNAIVQDHQGFIWFGTQEGVIRYDGQEMVVYEHNFKQQNSLSNDWVWSLLVDQDGNLWVGTDGGGLNQFDYETGHFKHFKHNRENPKSLSNNRVRVILQDRMGELWVGTDGGGLNRYNKENGEFTRYQHIPGDPNSLANDSVLSIYEDRSGNLWIGTNGGGLSLLDQETGKFKHFQYDPNNPSSISSNKVRAIYEDRDSNLWIGTYEAGLNLFNQSDKTFTRYQHNTKNKNSLSNNRIRSIYQDRQGTLWIATDGGLNEWLPELKLFNHYQNDPKNIDSISDDRISIVYEDRGGVLWVGTYNGVNKWNYVSDVFTYYQQTGTALKLNNNIVTTVTEASNGEIWVGTYGGGVNRINLNSGTVKYYETHSTAKYGLKDNRVMAIYIDKQEMVWIGTRNGGLSRLDPVSGKFKHYQHDAGNSNSININSISSIIGDADGTLWIGTYGGGLNRFDTQNNKFSVFQHDPNNEESLSSNRILSLYRDNTGFLWIGTEDGGLNCFEESNGSFKRYTHNPENSNSISSNMIIDIVEGIDRTLWVATGGGGLNQWLPNDRLAGRAVFTKYRKGSGLRSDTVQGIRMDDSGLLWLSSNRGLVQFDPINKKARYFDQSNGLKGNEFNSAARLKSRSGEFYFGGTTGLVSFDPEKLKLNRHEPDVSMVANTRLGSLDTRYSMFPSDFSTKLGYQEDLITFQFAALDYASPDKNLFSYKLEGFDQNWSTPGHFNRTTYTSLPAGDYTFRVKAANNDGIWNEKGASMKLTVIPAPWQTMTAYLIYTLSIIYIIYYYLRSQAKKLELETHQRIELEQQVSLRTQELGEKNIELNSANDLLKEASWTDSLTGLKNRRYLDEFIQTEVAQVIRRRDEMNMGEQEGTSTAPLDISPALSFMMIDLDGFKLINDTYGHHAGDQALIQVCEILQECCRKSDTIIRWGGDEFLIVGRSTTSKATEKLAERIRVGLAEHKYQLGEGNVGRLSGSIGYALYPFSTLKHNMVTWEQVASIADRAAYASKENGRNAWVGILGSRNISAEDCSKIKNNLETLVNNGRVTINTSIEGELLLNDKEKGRNVSR